VLYQLSNRFVFLPGACLCKRQLTSFSLQLLESKTFLR